MRRILIVDDEPEVIEILSEFLTLKGFDIIQASNGKIALDQFYAHHPDAAIVDMKMPVMNGLEFSRQILSKEKDFPIIIITAYIKKYSKEDFLKSGVRAVLQKPLELDEIYIKLQEIFS